MEYDMDDVNCPICGAAARLINDRHPGYQRSTEFSIFSCQYCDLQFSWPMVDDSAIYEHIYRQAAQLPGYDFYTGLARRIAGQSDPLLWLSRQAPGYWFVRDALTAKLPERTGRIMEIGSGLGYLTHAVRAAGYDATGLDISAKAVADATNRFGDHYLCAGLGDVARARPASLDAVILMEVLEHSASPVAMVKDAAALLRPGGFALVTTPNKTVYLAEDYWQTENPPIHLWWFSETSARRLAQAAGLDVAFWDFTRLHRSGDERRGDAHAPPNLPMKPPFLDEQGRAATEPARSLSPISAAYRRLKGLRDDLLPSLKKSKQERRRRRARQRWADQHGDIMGLVLTKPAR